MNELSHKKFYHLLNSLNKLKFSEQSFLFLSPFIPKINLIWLPATSLLYLIKKVSY